MKKKFGIIIAILLCVAFLLTFISCNNSDGSSLKGVDSSVIAEKDQLISKAIDKWLNDNATDEPVDLSAKLKEKLEGDSNFYLITSERKYIIPTIAVTYDKPTTMYKVDFFWTNGGATLKKTYSKKAVPAEYNGWAGTFKDGTYDDTTLDVISDEDEKLAVLDDILNAAFKMVNKTVSDSATGVFGVQGTIGVDTMGHNYGIEVKGNIDLNPIYTVAEGQEDPTWNENKTQFSLLLKNGDNDKTLGGFYYKNGSASEENTDKDSKIYFTYTDEEEEAHYYYIDYAILNQLFDKIGVSFDQEKGDVIKSAKRKDGIDLLFELIGLADKKSTTDMVLSIASGLIDAYESETDDGGKISVVDINFGNLMSTLSEYGALLNSTVQDILKDVDYLKDLDLTTMHGIIGHISIVVVADKNGRLTDFELNVNIPKCKFYLCEDESKTSFEIDPISFGIYAKDFVLSADKTYTGIIPQNIDREAQYFSPANFNIKGDVTIEDEVIGADGKTVKKDYTYRYELLTEINPFKPSEAKASITIKESEGVTFNESNNSIFFKMTYDQKTRVLATSGTAYGLNEEEDGVYYVELKKETLDDILVWLGITDGDWHGFSYNNKDGYYYVADWTKLLDSAKAFLDNDLGKYLLEYYISKKAPTAAGDAAAANISAAGETDLTDGSDEKDSDKEEKDIATVIKEYVGQVFDLINSVKDENVEIKDGGFSFKINARQINDLADGISDIIGRDLIAFLNRNIPGANIPDPINDPSNIELYVNTKTPAHEDQFYLTFTYAGDVYEILFDNTEDFTFSFKMTKADKTTYSFEIVFGDEIVSTYTNAKNEKTIVTHKNFEIKWGPHNTPDMYTDDEIANATKIFNEDGVGVGTQLVKGIMDIMNNDTIYIFAKMLGRFGVRQLVKVI